MKNRNSLKWLPVVVAAAIILRDEKFLLTKRRPESEQGSLWEFPGGKIESGETLEECLRREMREELGIEISKPQYFHSIRHAYPEKVVELHFFTCSIEQGQPQALGCTEMAWVDKHELIAHEFPPANIPMIKKIIQTEFSKDSVF